MKDMQRMFYATEAWGQKSKWVTRKQLHCRPDPKLRRPMREEMSAASARPTLKWSAITGRRTPKESLKDATFWEKKTSKAMQLRFYGTSSIYSWRGEIFFWDLKWDVVENLNPSWRKETMNEEATMVQATQPPSGLPELIFRRFCFSSKLDLCV